MKAVVMEINNKHAVVLSDNGCFETVNNKNYEIGQVIVMQVQKNTIMRKVMAVAATAAVVLLSVGSWAYASPYTYVSLDVNPSIEFTLNRFNRVIDVMAINDDGTEILENLKNDIRNASIDNAIAETVEKIKENGYLDNANVILTANHEENDTEDEVESKLVTDAEKDVENYVEKDVEKDAENNVKKDAENNVEQDAENYVENNTKNNAEINEDNEQEDSKYSGGIIITVSNNNMKLSEELSDKLRSVVEESVGDNVSVEVSSVAKERIKEAKKLGVSPGKLQLVEKLDESTSESINYTEWLDKPVKEIMSAIKANKAEEKAIKEKEKTEEKVLEEAQKLDKKDRKEVQKAEKNTREEAQKTEKKIREEAQKAEEKARKEARKAEEKAIEEAQKADGKAIKDAQKIEEKTRKEAQKAGDKGKKEDRQEEKKIKEETRKAEEKTREEARKAEKKTSEEARKAEKKSKEEARKAEKKSKEARNN